MSKTMTEFYQKMRAMQVVYDLHDMEIMEKMLRPCKVVPCDATEIVLIHLTEDKKTIAVNLELKTIEREIEFTEAIRCQANIIAGRHAGNYIDQVGDMVKDLRTIGIELKIKGVLPQNPKAGVYNLRFTYKGTPAGEWHAFFDVYDAKPCQKFSCYFS